MPSHFEMHEVTTTLPSPSIIIKDNIFFVFTISIFILAFGIIFIKSVIFGLLLFISYLLGCLSLHLFKLGNITISIQSLIPIYKPKKAYPVPLVRHPCNSRDSDASLSSCPNVSPPKPWLELGVDPKVDAALEELLCLLLKEHVYSWYRDISTDEAFVLEVKHSLRFLLSSLLKRAQQLDLVSLVLGPISQALLYHLERYLQGHAQALESNSAGSQVQEAVLRAYGPHLHVALASRANEISYLRLLASRLQPMLTPTRHLQCQNSATLTRELISTSVLLPVMDTIADPDIINHLLLIFFDQSPMVVFPKSTDPPVEFLAHFVSSPSNSKEDQKAKDLALVKEEEENKQFNLNLEYICGNQELQFIFMQFLKDESSLNLFQFIIDIDEFSSKLINPDLSTPELEELYESALGIYNTYMAPNAIDKIRFDPAIVNEIKEILDGPATDVTKLRTTSSLFKAHEQAYAILENIYCPLFQHSEQYYSLLTGGRLGCHEETNASSGSRIEKKYQHQVSYKSLPPTPLNMHSSSQGDELSLDNNSPDIILTGDEDDGLENGNIYDFDEDPRLKNLSAWRISIPKISTNMDAKCNFYDTFIIEVQRLDISSHEEPEDAHWTVERRYHEFYILEAKLLEFHGELHDIHLPPKRTLGKKTFQYLESQRPQFEVFLQRLLSLPSLQCSELLYKFLKSPAQFTSSIFPDFKIGKMIKNVPKKWVKEKGQHLNPFLQAFITSTESSKPKANKPSLKASRGDSPEPFNKSKTNSDLFTEGRPSSCPEDSSNSPTSTLSLNCLYESLLYVLIRVYRAPIWLIQLLSMVEGIAWQLLQSFAESFLATKLDQAFRPQRLVTLINLLKEVLFLDKDIKVRSPREKSERAREAFDHLMAFFPDIVVRILGKDNHEEGTRLLFNLLQYPLLNKQLSYVLLDIVVEHLFPEINN